MKILDCEQGSDKWLLARLGHATASNMGCIVTPTGKPCKSAARTRYMNELVGERITGLTTEHYASDAMKRGTALEPHARNWYTLQTGNEVAEVGFAYADSGRWGGSPDGLIDTDGGLEIKCPTLPNMIAHLYAGGVPAHWMVQIQACMWICERQWWDFCLFTDARNVPNLIERVDRDEAIISTLAEEVPAFCDELDAYEAELRARYDIPMREAADIEQASKGWCPI